MNSRSLVDVVLLNSAFLLVNSAFLIINSAFLLSRGAFPSHHDSAIDARWKEHLFTVMPFKFACLLVGFSLFSSPGLTPFASRFEPPFNFFLQFLVSNLLTMSDAFTLWFPAAWTVFGAVFTFLSFVLIFYVEFVRPNKIVSGLGRIVSAIEALQDDFRARLPPANPEAQTRMNEALITALRSHGVSIVEVLLDIELRLMTVEQSHHDALREIRSHITRLLTGPQSDAAVLPEILFLLQRPMKGTPKIQRKLPSFSLSNFESAYAKGLARERIQANSSSIHDLD